MSKPDRRASNAPTESASAGKCEIMLCREASVGRGPRSNLRLCTGHLAVDIERVRRLRADTEARIAALRAGLRDLEPRRMRMASDVQELEAVFDSLEAELDAWRVDIVDAARGRYDSLSSKIAACQHVVGYAEAIRTADRAGDYRRVYELAAQVEPTLELLNPSDGDVGEGTDVGSGGGGGGGGGGSGGSGSLLAEKGSLADVCSTVRNARFLLDRQMEPLTGDRPANAPPAELRRTLRNLGGEIECLTVCSKTSGVHCSNNSGGNLVAKDSSEAQRPLGSACLFVSYDSNERAHHILVIELPGNQRHRLAAEIDWSVPISDLHCDSSAQRLYISQGEDGVTVVSLWGSVLHKINANSLEHRLGAAAAVVSGRDLIFLLDGKEKRMLGIEKSGYSVSASFDLSEFFTGRPWMGGLAISGSRLLIADKGGRSLHKVCSLTGRLIASYPTAGASVDSPQLQRPTGVAVDSRGVIVVSDAWGQTVQLFLADGRLVQVLGTDGQAGRADGQFDGPQGLGLLETDPLSGQRLLYVADWRNQAVKEFQLF